ncbi:hypothetical protein [uncultured Clostridium sp.]|uniref:hypothetical protein n=1 Tax=uncultured Clostridium sp. TaxID=59620 RepID=UPI0025FEBFB7|nr:hypothetical protein [uncultured Clostridium sp.]
MLENVEEDALSNTESSISDFMKSGDDYLAAKDYENAKRRYEAAIYRNKSKEDTYLAIKDRYIKDKRFDDAYYIIQLAIESNVSVDQFKQYIDQCLDSKTGYDLLFWISTEDDIIVKMYMQYVS